MLATSKDILCQIAGKKLFTVLDEKDSYWQILLTEKSSDMCTFNTPFGRYSFLGMLLEVLVKMLAKAGSADLTS